MKATRNLVYKCLDGEREYQDKKWNHTTTPTGGQHSVTEFVLYMEHYLDEARGLLSSQADPKASQDGLDFIRKVCALGVCCMEQHGVVMRGGNSITSDLPATPATLNVKV